MEEKEAKTVSIIFLFHIKSLFAGNMKRLIIYPVWAQLLSVACLPSILSLAARKSYVSDTKIGRNFIYHAFFCAVGSARKKFPRKSIQFIHEEYLDSISDLKLDWTTE